MAFITQAPGEKSAVADVDVERTNGADSHPKELGAEPAFDSDEETHKQAGVRGIEAVTSVWDKKTLWIMMVLLYLVSFTDMLLVAIQTQLIPYITSDFSQHSLLSVVNIIATVLGGTCQLAIAKIIDIWGRPTGFLFMLLLNVIGNIIKATCRDVVTYTAGHTIYWVGHIGLLYVVDILLADMTSLKNRMLIFGINGTPTIATTFAGPVIAELFQANTGFRWAFGSFTIILVGICTPVGVVLLWHQRKADKLGLMPKTNSGRTWYQSIWHYLIEIDVVGIFLMTAGWALLLLPFSLATNTGEGWRSASMITMIVIGVVCLGAFVAWERWFAPVQFFPFKYLKERTIIGACLVYGIMFISVFAWDTYYTSYLQVVHNLTITTGGYVLNTFSLVSSFISPLIGLLMRYTGDYKYTSYAAIPVMAIGTGLLAKFRTPDSHVGLLVMCQVLNGIATGAFAQCTQLAIFATMTHQQIAVALAIWGLFGSIGAAIGSAIAGAIWTNVVPGELLKFLPEDKQDLMPEIYASLNVQQEYPIGDPIRDAIISAYSVGQHKMVIAGAAFVPVLVFCVLLFKNINVKKLEAERGTQTKGNVF